MGQHALPEAEESLFQQESCADLPQRLHAMCQEKNLSSKLKASKARTAVTKNRAT